MKVQYTLKFELSNNLVVNKPSPLDPPKISALSEFFLRIVNFFFVVMFFLGKGNNNEFVLDCHGLTKDELLYFLEFFDTLKLRTKLILITGVGNNSKKPQTMDYLCQKIWLSPLKEVIVNYYTKTRRGHCIRDNHSSIVVKLYSSYYHNN